MFVELEGKDVEEVFTAVLSPNRSNNQPEQSQHTHTAAGSKTNAHPTGKHTHTHTHTHTAVPDRHFTGSHRNFVIGLMFIIISSAGSRCIR